MVDQDQHLKKSHDLHQKLFQAFLINGFKIFIQELIKSSGIRDLNNSLNKTNTQKGESQANTIRLICIYNKNILSFLQKLSFGLIKLSDSLSKTIFFVMSVINTLLSNFDRNCAFQGPKSGRFEFYQNKIDDESDFSNDNAYVQYIFVHLLRLPLQNAGNQVLKNFPIRNDRTPFKNETLAVNFYQYILFGMSKGTTLKAGQTLQAEQYLESGNGYYAVMQLDGNFVLYQSMDWWPENAFWASNTDERRVEHRRIVMQNDGNLVMYDSLNKQIWASDTNGSGTQPYSLVMQRDRNLVIYDGNGQATWATGTNI